MYRNNIGIGQHNLIKSVMLKILFICLPSLKQFAEMIEIFAPAELLAPPKFSHGRSSAQIVPQAHGPVEQNHSLRFAHL